MANDYELENEVSDDTLLDDIEELKGFIQLMSGAYHVVTDKGIEETEINDVKYYKVDLTVKEVMELSEKPGEGEKAPVAGDVQSILWARNHRISMGAFKAFIQPIAERFGAKVVRDVLENSKGLELVITGKRTYNKEKDVYNFNVKKVMML